VPPSTSLNPERVSPELALVDPHLAHDARSALPQEDTLARIELLVRAHRIADSRAGSSKHDASVHAASARTPKRLRHRRPAVLAGAAAAAAVASALLVGVRVDLDGQPADANTSISVPPIATNEPSVVSSSTPHAQHRKKHVASHPPITPKRRAAATPRRFVWAPVPGAEGYRVQFFRGSKLVFEAETTKPEVTVPRSWTFHGVKRSLSSGSYRWNVWAVTGNVRQSKAVVQAELSISH
jgi:hypothetical protein